MVPKETRGSQVIQKVQGQDHQDQRAIQDCQATEARKEREAHRGHLDNRGLLDLMEPLGVPGVLATQENPDLVVIWVLKERKASQALPEALALQALQDSQDSLDQWV